MFKGNFPPTFDNAAFDNMVYDDFELDQNPGRIIRPLQLNPYQKQPRRR